MSTASGHVTTSQKKIHLVIHKKKKGRRLGAMVMCNEMDMLRGKRLWKVIIKVEYIEKIYRCRKEKPNHTVITVARAKRQHHKKLQQKKRLDENILQ